MHSKPLRQAVDLALDTLGMQGPVTRREVAEHVMRSAPDDYWSVGDLRDARIAYLQSEIASRMGEALSEGYIDRFLPHVPEQHRAMLQKVPRFICISPRGGREAQHVMSFVATVEHWDANFKLKDHVVQATTVSRDFARDIRDLLLATGCRSLIELPDELQAAE